MQRISLKYNNECPSSAPVPEAPRTLARDLHSRELKGKLEGKKRNLDLNEAKLETGISPILAF